VDQARQTLVQFEKTFPESYDYATAVAWFPAGVGSYDSALRAWVNVGLRFREPSQQADVHQTLAALNQIQGKLAEAERQFQQLETLAEQRGDSGGALLASSSLAFGYPVARHDSTGALRVLEAALARHPLNRITPYSRPYAVLIMAYAVAGQPAQARRLLTEFEATRPDEVRNRWGAFLRGYIALAEHHAPEAIASFRQVVEQSRVCIACGYWELGLAFDQADLPDSALTAYEQVANDPSLNDEINYYLQWTLAPSLRRLGELYEARGDRAKAAEYYSRLVELWKDADPVLQPEVRAAKARLAHLAGEGPP
jgi:tetratricopeptide (TPR) repeat protein